MRILSIALGGCFKAPPVHYGITEDTGGHIAYILGETLALAQRADVERAEVVTRRFDAPELGDAYAAQSEWIGPKALITRIDSGDRRYLCKEALAADRPAFTAALIANLRARNVLPDIIHAHFADAADVAAAVRAELGIPFVYTAHSLGIDKRQAMPGASGLDSRIAEENRAIALADAVIGSSRDECERQIMAYPGAAAERIHCIPPGVDKVVPSPQSLARARALIAPFLRDAEKPMILAIARAVTKKNLVGLVDMVAGSPALRERANLVILAGLRDGLESGEGEQCAVLRGLVDAIDRADLYGHVAYPRRHDHDDVHALYALAAAGGGVFVNPAFTEPYGLTLIEAASHGLPVVATSHGGAGDIVAEIGHGIAADPADKAGFSAAIELLLTDKGRWRRASAKGREGAARLDWGRYADRLLAVARNVTGRRASSAASSALAGPEALAATGAAGLVLSDIDNTLTGCTFGAGRFARHLRRNPGHLFGIATGRSLQEAQRILAEWRLPRPDVLVTSVGSEIYWQDNGLRADTGYAAMLATEWQRDAIERAVRPIAGLRPQAAVEQRAFKLSYFTDDPAVASDVAMVLKDAGLTARVIHSHGNFLDILPVGGGKANAMRWVARALGVDMADVTAIGDSGNDRDMLEACPNAVIVANHDADIAALRDRANVYVSRRPHAGGALEGVLACRRRRRVALAQAQVQELRA